MWGLYGQALFHAQTLPKSNDEYLRQKSSYTLWGYEIGKKFLAEDPNITISLGLQFQKP